NKGQQGLDTVLAVVKSNRGKKAMDQARDLFAELTGEEQELLKRREADAHFRVEMAGYAINVGAVLAFVVVTVVGVVTARSVTRPLREAINQLTSASAEILASTTEQA